MAVLESHIDVRGAAFAQNLRFHREEIARLRERLRAAATGGRDAHIRRHRARGKWLVRERINFIVDDGTPFLELSPLAAWGQYGNEVPGAGIVTGVGIVAGRPCMFIANDATVKGGSFFHETVKKHVRAQEIAQRLRLPCLYLVDCGGAYLPEQDRVFPDKDHFGNSFHRQCRMSQDGIPQLSAVFGGCTAGGAYIPALSDEVIMVRGNARIHLGGPSIVKIAINETVDGETLGGAEMHTRVSGVSDYLADDEAQALALLRQVVAKLPPEPGALALVPPLAPRPPRYDPAELDGIVPADPKQPYDAREIIARLLDGSEFHEFKPLWGETLVTGFGVLHGQPVAVLANNGALIAEASLKGAHFIELANQRGVPLLFLHNIAGFMVGSEAERAGIAKHSAKMVYAQSCARVPKLSLVVGGSYGAGNYGMCGRGFEPEFLFAWPSARVATMSADIASNVMTELARSNLRGPADEARVAEVERQVREQYARQSDPYYATSRLWDDGLIEPSASRDVLGLALALAMRRSVPQTATPVYRM
ncbi:acyl-CoA carboxylase subunit beta [Extensimonas vulgaris]|uniref:3-methylcrotonyl-CoA carboxylase beta subunit n=1 Tax=Extensimonas vulgaris TaxID=1031594 RepID=A0A369AJ66_9BURK|nr:carboxyl transferase domain-containing protein [Extensimonas vulgaris]RCX09410.1 3-methylcrotonyl-CoA carboxylase beta subunit [Extensimonas vulgaris]TWI38541.1 3-methylcrotonyl-CoA carboxylase beta subunit [Extensimonas vulgaris]TXD13534.1 methylcrotonoyl-CoA carboxylase [Extensimonas vulgaris]